MILVKDVMAQAPRTCRPGSNLAAAAEMLRTAKCGALPVVDENERLVGILTDRDICIRLGTLDRKPSEVTAGEVMARDVATCCPDDEVHSALKTMRGRKVRRLPVVAKDGTLTGMLSVSELLLHARPNDGSRPELSDQDVMSTLRGIDVHCPPHVKCA
jgi:CBS domain-containing protein